MHAVLAYIKLHPIAITAVVLFVAWLAWEAWCIAHPGPPRAKIPVDVGILNVRIVWIDSSANCDYEIKGSCSGFWAGKPDVWDATRAAKYFVEDDLPIHLGDNKFAPRHRVHRYIIGERNEHIIEV